MYRAVWSPLKIANKILSASLTLENIPENVTLHIANDSFTYRASSGLLPSSLNYVSSVDDRYMTLDVMDIPADINITKGMAGVV